MSNDPFRSPPLVPAPISSRPDFAAEASSRSGFTTFHPPRFVSGVKELRVSRLRRQVRRSPEPSRYDQFIFRPDQTSPPPASAVRRPRGLRGVRPRFHL